MMNRTFSAFVGNTNKRPFSAVRNFATAATTGTKFPINTRANRTMSAKFRGVDHEFQFNNFANPVKKGTVTPKNTILEMDNATQI